MISQLLNHLQNDGYIADSTGFELMISNHFRKGLLIGMDD
jgi:hypothetical protein